MAFGNPYGDTWNSDIAIYWTKKLSGFGIKIFAMADTVGVSDPKKIKDLFSNLIPEFPSLEIGAHLHTTPGTWREKMEAAWNTGCRRFDSVIKGYGGCPMAADKLTGNMSTENLLSFLKEKKIESGINETAFQEAMNIAGKTFPI
jgi:hydroxymethylglutaryl-CoA lyase